MNHASDDGGLPHEVVAKSDLVATYGTVEAAQQAEEALRLAGFKASAIKQEDVRDDAATAAVEQREERDQFVEFGPVPATTPMLKGGWRGIVAVTVPLGAIGLILAVLLVGADIISTVAGFALVAGGVAAGIIAGAILGAGSRAQDEQFADMQTEHRVGLGSEDPDELSRAESILRQTNPIRIDRFHGGDR